MTIRLKPSNLNRSKCHVCVCLPTPFNAILLTTIYLNSYVSHCYVISLGIIQGLALINGTQLITALGAEALSRAETIAKQADIIAALSLDVLQGTPKAFDYGILYVVCVCM